MRPDGRTNESGFAAVLPAVIIAGAIFMILLLFIIVTGAAGSANNPNGQGTGDGAGEASDIPPQEGPEVDLGTRRLRCAFLPGVRPMSDALDARVVRRWITVKQELDEKGVRVKVNYGFRTLCQQINVNPGGNAYADPRKGNISPHMCGRAVDINGLRDEGYAARVVPIFQRHGWKWLGAADRPHFEVPKDEVGESLASVKAWSDELQRQYQQARSGQGEASGCVIQNECQTLGGHR